MLVNVYLCVCGGGGGPWFESDLCCFTRGRFHQKYLYILRGGSRIPRWGRQHSGGARIQFCQIPPPKKKLHEIETIFGPVEGGVGAPLDPPLIFQAFVLLKINSFLDKLKIQPFVLSQRIKTLYSPIVFIFMQFSTRIMPNNRLAPPPSSWVEAPLRNPGSATDSKRNKLFLRQARKIQPFVLR